MLLPVPAPERRPLDSLGVGLNAVDHLVIVPSFPQSGSKVEYSRHTIMFGGQVASAMVALSRLGLRTAYIGCVGDDDSGRMQLESIRSEGVAVDASRIVEGAETQTAFILVEEVSGERTVLWHRDEKISIRPEDIDHALVKSARSLHLDGHNIEAEVLAARLARESGVPVSIDVDKDYGGADLYPLVDYLITSEGFPERVTGVQDARRALVTLQERFGNAFVAMTRGRRGALALCGGVFFESPALDIPARDTTGAGDAFHAGFLFGLLSGYDVSSTLRVANAVAAMNCMQLGARGGLPTREELVAFLERA